MSSVLVSRRSIRANLKKYGLQDDQRERDGSICKAASPAARWEHPFFLAHFCLWPVRTNILIHHFCLTSWKSWEDPTDQQLSCQSSKSPSDEQNCIKLWPKTAFHRFCCPTLPVSHPENPLVTSFSLQPSAPLVSDVWNISSSFALSARSPSLPTLWYHAATRSIFSCICTFFLKSCIFQGNTSAIDSHLFDLLEAGQDWTEICDKSDRTKFQPREYCETRKLTLFSKFSIT